MGITGAANVAGCTVQAVMVIWLVPVGQQVEAISAWASQAALVAVASPSVAGRAWAHRPLVISRPSRSHVVKVVAAIPNPGHLGALHGPRLAVGSGVMPAMTIAMPLDLKSPAWRASLTPGPPFLVLALLTLEIMATGKAPRPS